MPSTFTEHFARWRSRWQSSLPASLLQRFAAADVMTQSASLAFYAVLSLAPLLVLLLWLTASLYPSAQDALLDQFDDLVGDGAAGVARTIISNADAQPGMGSLAGVWSTLLLFGGASAVFARLQSALNLIFLTANPRFEGIVAWLRKRIFSFGIVLALGFLLLVSMTLGTALQVVFARAPSVLPTIANLTSLVVYAAAFAFLYHYLPDRRVRWKQAFLGGLLTAALFILGRYLIGIYISEVAPGSAYGTMGALVILLVWIYYASVVFFCGAILTAIFDERLSAAAVPTSGDTPSRPPMAS